MRRSESIEKLAEALASAQAEIKDAAKDKENSHFRSKYADLASIWDACRLPLTSHGLAVIQTTEPGESGGIVLETTLAHTSGQWVSGAIPVNCDTKNPQAIGSALTYARRYGLAAMVGVCPDDDDGEAAVQPQRGQQGRQQPPAPRNRERPDVRRDDRPRTAAPADEWLGYIADRAGEAQARWVKAMETEHVEGTNRTHPDFQMPGVHEVNNHFVSHAIQIGAIKQEDVAKDGKPGVRDAAKSKAALTDLYRKAPKKVRERVDAYFAAKEQAMRVKLGMNDLDLEPAAAGGREPGSDDDM